MKNIFERINKKEFKIVIICIIFISVICVSLFIIDNFSVLKNDSITGYTCPSGWSKEGSKCYRSATNNDIKKCPDGFKEENGSCVKSAKISGYSCSKGWSKEGSKCSRQATNTPKYYCYPGWKKTSSGNECYKGADSRVKYDCSKGWSKEGSGANLKCYKTATTTSYCPKNYKYDSKTNKCKLDLPAYKIPGTNIWQCSSGGKLNKKTYRCTDTKKLSEKKMCSIGNLKGNRCYISSYRYTEKYCNLGSKRGNYCYRTLSVEPHFKCSTGNLKGTRCYITATPNYKCDSGSIKGSKCYANKVSKTSYSCSVGNLSGTRCYITATPIYKKESNNNSPASIKQQSVKKMTDVAKSKVGNGGYEFRNYYWGSDNDFDWCAAFIWWLFNQDNTAKKTILKRSFADDLVRDSVAAGLGTWYEDECTDSNTSPQSGDLIVFDPMYGNSGMYIPYPLRATDAYPSISSFNTRDKFLSSHIGFVYQVDNLYVYTIEGNRGNLVKSMKYKRKFCGSEASYEQRINGYYRPNYNK